MWAFQIRKFCSSEGLLAKFDITVYRPKIPSEILNNAGKTNVTTPAYRLMFVYKIAKWKGLPWYEKKILHKYDLGCSIPTNQRVVVKNTPDVCKNLWQIKHLIRIVPITFPFGEPTSSDLLNTRIDYETGRVELVKSFADYPQQLSPEMLENSCIPGQAQDLVKVVEHAITKHKRKVPGNLYMPEKYRRNFMTGKDMERYHRDIWS